MEVTGKEPSSTADRELRLSRVYDAPRELVFDAITDPAQVAQWWGPNGFTNTIQEMDVRPGGVQTFSFEAFGGKTRLTMHLPQVNPCATGGFLVT